MGTGLTHTEQQLALLARLGDLYDAGGMPSVPDVLAGAWRKIWLLDAHSSAALDGNGLTSAESHKLLDTGIPTGSKHLVQYLEVMGCAQAADWVYRQPALGQRRGETDCLTHEDMVHVAVLLTAPVASVQPDYAPLAIALPHDGDSPAQAWFDEVNAARTKLRDGAYIADVLASSHASFAEVSPLERGTGRLGRALLTLQSIRLSYPPVVIPLAAHGDYHHAMHEASQGNTLPLSHVIARSMMHSIDTFGAPKPLRRNAHPAPRDPTHAPRPTKKAQPQGTRLF